jgi:hypothetical protein
MDANLLRKFLSIANKFDTGRVTYDGRNVKVEGDDTVYLSNVKDLNELEKQVRKDREN